MTDEVLVSVCIVAYNQENYISECLESLVNQKTNFKYEIIVGEDCSTDKTRSIVQEYVDLYPEIMVPLFYEKNVGPIENIKRVYEVAQGKYIAHIDGDDVALAGKLQGQFDALETNVNCNICSHNMKNIDENSQVTEFQNWNYPAGVYTLFDLYHRMPFFAHSSKMFRNNIRQEDWNSLFANPEILDMDIHFLNLQSGNIIHLDKALGQYRVNVGMSNTGKKVNPLLPKGAIRIFEKGLKYFENDKIKLEKIKKLYAVAMLQCAYNYAVYESDIDKFRGFLKKSLEQNKLTAQQFVFILFSIFPNFAFYFLKKRAQKKGL